MSKHLDNVALAGRSLLLRLEEVRRDGDSAQERALRGRIAETRRALAGLLEEHEKRLEQVRQVLRDLEGQEGVERC